MMPPIPRLIDEFAPATILRHFTRLEGARRKFQQRLTHRNPILFDQNQAAVCQLGNVSDRARVLHHLERMRPGGFRKSRIIRTCVRHA